MANDVVQKVRDIASDILIVGALLVFVLATVGSFIPAFGSAFGIVVPAGLGFVGGLGVLALAAIAVGFLNRWL